MLTMVVSKVLESLTGKSTSRLLQKLLADTIYLV